MKIIRLTAADVNSHLMDDLFVIYTEALPISEQKPRHALEGMVMKSNYYFYVFIVGGNNIGFAIVYSPNDIDYALLEYMAIDKLYRNKSYGGKMFFHLKEVFTGKNIIVEIESPHQKTSDRDIRKKRFGFYVNLGCSYVEGLHYILPLESSYKPPEMLLLVYSQTYNRFIPKNKLEMWISDIYAAAYGCSVNDSRIAVMLELLPKEVRLSKTL